LEIIKITICLSLYRYFSLVECPEMKVLHYDVQTKYTDNNIEVYTTIMQPKPFVIHLFVGVMILSLIFFNQVLTLLSTPTTVAAAELIDIELKDKDIKQGLGTSETKPTNENNIVKQEEEEKEKQESNGYTRARGLEEHNITIDNIHLSDVIPFELPFANSLPFP
jgi:hypothetical protein